MELDWFMLDLVTENKTVFQDRLECLLYCKVVP